MRRVLVLVAAVALPSVAAAAALAALAAFRSPRASLPSARASGPAPLAASSRLPVWLAPGGRLAVAGRAGARQVVLLLVDGRRLAAGTSDELGRFRLRVAAPPAGRYRLALATPGRRLELGVLHVRPLVLAAVGDVTLGGAVEAAVAAAGPAYPWLAVGPLLRAADLATANLEGAVSLRGTAVAGKQYIFRGSPSALAAAVRRAGIDVLSLANNHTLDYGPAAFLDTIRIAWRLGVATVGGGAGLAAARRPAILERGGLRLAFLGYSDVRPLGFTAGVASAGTAPALPELITADIRRARRRADLVVVWFHWGVERASAPSPRQRALAALALNAGASVVLGAHPHVLQPLSRPDPHRLVAWSLGNFVFPAVSPATARTGLLRVLLGAQGVLGYSLRPASIAGVQPRLR